MATREQRVRERDCRSPEAGREMTAREKLILVARMTADEWPVPAWLAQQVAAETEAASLPQPRRQRE